MKDELQQSDRERWDERYALLEPERRGSPSPFVADCLPYLPRQGLALDIAAGNGRHSVLLAEHGLRVDALDISWQGLRKAQERAARHGVAIRPLVVDMQRGWLPNRQYAVVVNSFFLLRDLIPAINAAIKPGGWLVFETLTVHQLEITPHRFKTREHLLAPGELVKLFSDLQNVQYWEGEENNTATARLLARKGFG